MANLSFETTDNLQKELDKRNKGDIFVLAGDDRNIRIERLSYGFNFCFSMKLLGFRKNVTCFLSTDDLIRLEHWLRRAVDKNICDLEG